MGIENCNTNYWYKSASVITRPRRILEGIDPGQTLFPLARQPLAFHPIITDIGEECVSYILTQSAYRYMYEIATLETETVNSVALKIATNKYQFLFSFEQCQQAMSIIVDEAYHAYVALDFIQQSKKITGIEPILLPKDNAVQRVLNNLKMTTPAVYYDLLELVTVCLSEHVLTKDIIYMHQESSSCAFFNQIMQDHLVDEIRHANYFSQILKYVWDNIAETEKEIIANYLPQLINGYIDFTPQKNYDKDLLLQIGLNNEVIKEILFDIYFTKDKNLNLNVINFLSVLKKTKVLEHPCVGSQLSSHGFIYTNSW